MRLNVAVPEAKVSKPVLDAALEAVTRLNESLLADGSVPLAKEAIKNGVLWKPEPYESEHFDHAGIVNRRGWGDCDDLAPYHAASLRHTGEDPEATAIVRRSGPTRWHAIVQRSNGNIDDPSRWAGMGRRHDGVNGTGLALMYPAPSGVSGIYEVKPAIAIRPNMGRWQARVDIPWHTHTEFGGGPLSATDYAMASLAAGRSPVNALVGAIEGACKIGLAAGIAHPDHVNRLCAMADLCEGVPFEDVAHCYGIEHAMAAQQVVGSLFGKIKNIAKKAAKFGGKLAMKGLRFVPGASQALSAYDLAKEAYDAAKTLKNMGVHPGDIAKFVHAGFPSIPG